MANLFEALLSDDEIRDPAAIAAALRRQQKLGTLGQLMGVAPTREVGGQMVEGAQTSLRSATAKQQAAKEAAARAEERKQAQANWQAQMERDQARDAEQRRQFAIQEARLGRSQDQEGKKQWAADPVTGRLYNQITGEWKDAPQEGATDDSGLPPSGLRVTQPGGKPPTEGEAKSGMRSGVALGALETIAGAKPEHLRPGFAETTASFFGLPSAQQTLIAGKFGGPERNLVRGAQDAFIDAALTEMTGAAYTEHQIAAFRNRFMPNYFDSPETQQKKAEAALGFVRQQAMAAGKAWTPERDMLFRQMMQASMAAPQEQGTPQAQGVSPQGGDPDERYFQ